jgi:hypothetical protein
MTDRRSPSSSVVNSLEMPSGPCETHIAEQVVVDPAELATQLCLVSRLFDQMAPLGNPHRHPIHDPGGLLQRDRNVRHCHSPLLGRGKLRCDTCQPDVMIDKLFLGRELKLFDTGETG